MENSDIVPEAIARRHVAGTLGRYVRELVQIRGGCRRDVLVLPTLESSLLIRFDDARATASIVGVSTMAREKRRSVRGDRLSVRFWPGGASTLFPHAPSSIVDGHRTIDDLVEGVMEPLVATDRADERFPVLERFLRRHVPAAGHVRMRAVREVLADLLESDGSVAKAADRVGVTPRQLHRFTVEHVGLGPKACARVLRFRRAISRHSASRGWAETAAVAGYFDQSHLIGEFSAMTGSAPGALTRRLDEKDIVR